MADKSQHAERFSNPDPPGARNSLERSLELGRATLVGVELRDTLLSIFRSPDYKPPVLPAVALELTALTRKENVSYDDVAGVIERDPLLVASVLKLVQSPVYGGRARVHSLLEALSRLGINTLRDIVWQVVIGTRVFRCPAYAGILERVQAHSAFTAHAARVVANHAGIEAEHAFLCGLLHDVGWSGTLAVVSTTLPAPPHPEVVYSAIDKMHSEAAAIMGELWGLAPEIVEVIGHHHDPHCMTSPGLVPVLCVAEQLAEDFDFAIEARSDSPLLGLDENLVGRHEHAVSVLGLSAKLDRIRAQVEEVASRLRAGADK